MAQYTVGKQLGGETITLAENNATAISAVRAMWSDVPGFDFGLCLFMILNGAIYVRQLINGEWYDAEVVAVSRLPVEGGVSWYINFSILVRGIIGSFTL